MIKKLKRFTKKFLYRPRKIGHLGLDSWFLRPYFLDEARFIHVGIGSLIRERSWLRAFSNYEGKSFIPNISIGDGVYIGRDFFVACANKIFIGNKCVISEQVYITDCVHGIDPTDDSIMAQPLNIHPDGVVIGNKTFIGIRAVIMPGVSLGENCVVLANSVVTKSFPAYSMIGGVPAAIIKRYDFEMKSWKSVTSEKSENSKVN